MASFGRGRASRYYGRTAGFVNEFRQAAIDGINTHSGTTIAAGRAALEEDLLADMREKLKWDDSPETASILRENIEKQLAAYDADAAETLLIMKQGVMNPEAAKREARRHLEKLRRGQ
jgi:hypothetical protein